MVYINKTMHGMQTNRKRREWKIWPCATGATDLTGKFHLDFNSFLGLCFVLIRAKIVLPQNAFTHSAAMNGCAGAISRVVDKYPDSLPLDMKDAVRKSNDSLS